METAGSAELISQLVGAVVGVGALWEALRKFRVGMQSGNLSAWLEESEHLQRMEERAGLSGPNRPRNDMALALAARAQMASRTARRMVPSKPVADLACSVLGAIMGAVATAFLILAIFTFWVEPEPMSVEAQWMSMVLAPFFLAVGVVLFMVGLTSSSARTRMQVAVQRVLLEEEDTRTLSQDQKTGLPQDLRKKGWYPGSEVRFSFWEQRSLSVDLMDTFTVFMRHAELSDDVDQPEASARWWHRFRRSRMKS